MSECHITLLFLTSSLQRGSDKGTPFSKWRGRHTFLRAMEETRIPIFSQQLSDLSTLTGKLIKYCDNISGVSGKCCVLTFKACVDRKQSCKRGISPVGRRWFSPAGTQVHCSAALHWPSSDSSTFNRSMSSARKSLLYRMDWVPGHSDLLGLTQPGEQGAFMGDHRCLYTKWQFSSSIIPCYCITRSYREASISFLRF